MSTKIYDGILVDAKDIYELNTLIKSIRERLIPVAQKELYKVKALMMEAAIVYRETGVEISCPIRNWKELDRDKEMSIRDIRYFVDREVIKLQKKNNATDSIVDYTRDIDMDVKLSIMPIPGKFLGIRYINNPALEDAFMSCPEILEYGYWNNTDKPTSISDEDWDKRCEEWDIALTGIGIPADCGFEYVVIDTLRHAEDWVNDYNTQVFPYLTDVDKLRTKIAKTQLLEQQYQKIKEENDADECMRIYFKARDYVKTHPEDVEELKKSITIDVKAIMEEAIINKNA